LENELPHSAPRTALPQSRCRQPFLVVLSAASAKRTGVAAGRARQLDGTFEAASAGLVVGIGAHIGRGRMNTYDRVSTQASELKALAQRFNVTVVAILTRATRCLRRPFYS